MFVNFNFVKIIFSDIYVCAYFLIWEVSALLKKQYEKLEGGVWMIRSTIQNQKPTKMLTGKQKKYLKLLLLLFPFMAYVGLFSYFPLFGWSYAFLRFNPALKISKMQFVGLDNFSALFRFTGALQTVLTNTFAISGLSLLTTVLPVIFAILISMVPSKKYAKFVQSVTTIPNFISWVLVYSLFFSLFAPESGVVNQLLIRLGLVSVPTDPLGDVNNAWFVQTGVGIWKNLGWGAIIYLAAIAGIDQELYESAAIDGANRFQSTIHITLPGLANTYFVLLLLAISNILSNGFEQYWVFQNPMTVPKLEVFDTYVYRLAMVNNQYAFSTAMSIMRTIVSVTLLFSANRLSKRVRGESIV